MQSSRRLHTNLLETSRERTNLINLLQEVTVVFLGTQFQHCSAKQVELDGHLGRSGVINNCQKLMCSEDLQGVGFEVSHCRILVGVSRGIPEMKPDLAVFFNFSKACSRSCSIVIQCCCLNVGSVIVICQNFCLMS